MRVFTTLFLLMLMSIFTFGQSRVRAPELSGGKSWLNTEKPLSLQALRGKIVLLDFWTYGCINCIHIIPDLKKLEAKYPNELVVIGVHSAKFDNEAETENIRKIILRYELEHPVVNDADYKIWNQYAVRAYPTLVLIDPNGYIIGNYVGEGNAAEIEKKVAETVAEFRQKGQLDEKPLNFALERAKVGNLPLAFPGKVLADEKSNRLFIADSNHNRIVVTDLQGKLLLTIGNGEAGLEDGSFQSARFNSPQGMALDGESLYVSDTENHALRLVDLKKGLVETLAGDGKQANWRSLGGNAKNSRLSSPWDVLKIGNALYIAMAGTHQIWKLDLATNAVAPFAGTGAEARVDGQINEAAFSQPSGLATDGKKIWVADSEANIIREIDLQKNEVKTLVGGDLWVFGDQDGFDDDVRLQHPLGVVLYEGKVLIADTYNHKIKQLEPGKRWVKTFLGNGKAGQVDGAKPQFYEPGGLSIAGGKLFIADTNNHAIRVVDLKSKAVSTLRIEGLSSPKPYQETSVSPNLIEINEEVRDISTGGLSFDVELPKGYHLNKDAPNRYELTFTRPNGQSESLKGKLESLPFESAIPPGLWGELKLGVKLTIFYCRKDNTGECLIKTIRWNVPVRPSNNGSSGIALSHKIE